MTNEWIDHQSSCYCGHCEHERNQERIRTEMKNESRCVVCGGEVKETVAGWADKHGYHCVRCKLRYCEPPPKAYGLEDKVRIVE